MMKNQQIRQGVALLAAALLGAVPATVPAAVLTWGVGGAGGVGTWTTSTTNWWNGSTNTNWSDTTGVAEFRGTSGADDHAEKPCQ